MRRSKQHTFRHAKSGSDDVQFVTGPRGHAGEFPEPEELKRWKLERIRRAGTHIMGRVTYEEMAAHWPS
jgi:hypothetical protein